MSITGTLEYKEKKEKVQNMEASNLQLYAGYFFEAGAEWCEQQLTAQHDKEMVEFAEWVGSTCKKGYNSWEYFGDGPVYSTTELLQLFRNRNK